MLLRFYSRFEDEPYGCYIRSLLSDENSKELLSESRWGQLWIHQKQTINFKKSNESWVYRYHPETNLRIRRDLKGKEPRKRARADAILSQCSMFYLTKNVLFTIYTLQEVRQRNFKFWNHYVSQWGGNSSISGIFTFLLHYDNAPAHSSNLNQKFLVKHGKHRTTSTTSIKS